MIKWLFKITGSDKELEKKSEIIFALEKELSILKYHLRDGEILKREADANHLKMKAESEVRKQEQRLRLLEKGYDIEPGRNGIVFVSMFKDEIVDVVNDIYEHMPKKK